MICNAGNRGKEEAEILNFLLAQIHYHFQFTLCFCKGRMTGVGVHIPQLCLLRWAFRDTCSQPSLDPGDSSCDQEISYTALPVDLSQDFHPEMQRWQRVTQAAGKPVTLAAWTSWHFAGGQEPAWCNSLETHLQVCFIHPCLEETTQQGEEHCTCSASLFPGILSPKTTGNVAGSCIAWGL